MKDWLKRPAMLARAVTTVSMAGVLLAATAGTAAAATSSGAGAAAGTCPFTRTLCLWDGTGYTGAQFNVQALNPSVGTCVDLAAHGWPNGRAKSGKNTASQPARLYTGTNCTGSVYQIMPGGSYGSIKFASNSVYVY
jgi:hypothetical protein